MTRLKRQQFLGPESDGILAGATIGLVGLGGGGSHVAQQLAHLGVGGFVLIDLDTIDFGNTNRLVGGTLADVKADKPKTEIAARQILGINPAARIIKFKGSWHDATPALKACDVIIGGIDSFTEREQLERFARRHLVPYIDIGMDVHDIGEHGFLIAGQVVLSSPGHPCLRCCGVVTDDNLALEAARYGAAGERPQVVWPNAILASSAVGLAVSLLTPWHRKHAAFAFLAYDGNKGTVSASARMSMLGGTKCPHHPPDETGEPLFDIRKHLAAEGH
ncbi:MAG: ThiF family adenylyltransferase [Hyphomicrobium zavarzinii]|uniref:HesA/MoeB/ThiF family protein n=1 Tax=Hyphomicrobium zavarzinii TaxID=48292 RepID=UPI001A62AD8F|nr:ThiF family adenylyltransferase [Hyphomicrobium zavarzinii]MBL8846951.1 ThiF family adenylyltransferase [Hyphomicrobium zavarzinii]